MVSGNDYVIQVKGNQKYLLQAVKTHIAEHDPSDIDHTSEINRGRKENREVHLYNDVTGKVFDQWKGLKTIVFIRNWGVRNHKKYEQLHYYISSRTEKNARIYGQGIRGHWYIENKLHWTKDAILGEDRSLIKGNDLARNLSLIRTMVINIYKLNEEMSIKSATEKFNNRISKCVELMNIKHSHI